MRTRSLAAIAVVAALAASVLSVTPVSAAQATFTNPLATAATDNFDITSIDTDFTPSRLTVTAHSQNLVAGDVSYFVYVLPAGKSLAENNGAFAFGGERTGNSTVAGTRLSDANGSVTSISPNAQVSLAIDVATQTIVASISTASLPVAAPVDVFGVAFIDSGSAFFAKTLSETPVSVTGLGPVRIDPTTTSTGVTLSFPSQTYGATPVTAIVSVSPITAPGTVQVLADGVLVATGSVSNGSAFAVLPSSLASGGHAITATFVPANAQDFASSTSAAVPLTVISAALATKTTVKLSKKTQTFKKSASKVTVTVSGKPAGTVAIYDGKKKLKTVTLKKGKASYTLSKKLKKGTHKIKAVFTPTSVEAFAPSTSKVVKLKVKK